MVDENKNSSLSIFYNLVLEGVKSSAGKRASGAVPIAPIISVLAESQIIIIASSMHGNDASTTSYTVGIIIKQSLSP